MPQVEPLTLTGVGAAGVFIVLVLRELRQWLNDARAAKADDDEANGKVTASSAARGKIHEMHRVLMREDTDGVPLVYRYPDIAKSLGKIEENTAKGNEILEKVATELAGIRANGGRANG